MRSATREERELLFAEAAGAARAVLAGAGTHGPDTQFELLHGLFWFLVHVADRGPLVIVVDDLHWADPGSRGVRRLPGRGASRSFPYCSR